MDTRTYKLITLLILLTAPALALAATITSPSLPFWGGGSSGLLSCTGATCHSLCDLIQTFVNVTYFGITLVLFIAAPILFAWGGIMLIISGGNPGKTGEAKKILTGTLIGVVIVLSAFIIIKLFVDLFSLSSYIQGFGSSFNCSA